MAKRLSAACWRVEKGLTLRIVARGYNRVNGLQRKIAHAEIVTLENASEPMDGKPALPLDAEDAILVSTLEPCVMCLGAAMEAGIKTVLFGLTAPADNGTQRVKPPESPESKTPEITRQNPGARELEPVRDLAARQRRHSAGRIRKAAPGADRTDKQRKFCGILLVHIIPIHFQKPGPALGTSLARGMAI